MNIGFQIVILVRSIGRCKTMQYRLYMAVIHYATGRVFKKSAVHSQWDKHTISMYIIL